jgi:hypothetical protein
MLSFARYLPLTVVLLVGCDMKPTWKELSLPADSVRVQMPGKWKEQSVDQGKIYQTITGGTEYLLGVHTVPQNNLGANETRQVLRQVRDAMIGALPGGKLVSESDTELEGRPGVEFEGRGTNNEIAKARLFLTNGKMMSVMVVYKNAPRSQENVDKFFKSLTFDLSKPVADATPPAPPPAPGVPVPPVATSPAPSPAPPAVVALKEDRRTAWKYENAPQVFPDQKGYNGVIHKTGVGDAWLDNTETGPLEFIEVARTPEYVELKRPVGDFRVRLYNDRSEYKFGYSPNFLPMFPGKWE